MAPTGYPGTRNVNNELAKQMVSQSLVSNAKAFFLDYSLQAFLNQMYCTHRQNIILKFRKPKSFRFCVEPFPKRYVATGNSFKLYSCCVHPELTLTYCTKTWISWHKQVKISNKNKQCFKVIMTPFSSWKIGSK